MANDRDIVQEAKKFHEAAQSEWGHCIDDYRKDYSFCTDADQWSDEAKKRVSEDRPRLSFHREKPALDNLENSMRKNPPMIHVIPGDNGSDPKTAEQLAGVIRNIEFNSQSDQAYLTAFHHVLRGGFMAFWVVDTRYVPGTFDQECYIRRILNPLSVSFDWKFVSQDGRDATRACIIEEMSRDAFKAEFPKIKDKDIEELLVATGDWNDDKNKKIKRTDYYVKKTKHRKLLLIEFKGQQVVQYEDELNDAEKDAIGAGLAVVKRDRDDEVPYVCRYQTAGEDVVVDRQEWNLSCLPVIPIFGQELITPEGRRYFKSMLHYAKDSIRGYNYIRSREIEAIAERPNNPIVVTDEQIKGYENEWSARTPRRYVRIRRVDGALQPFRVQQNDSGAELFRNAQQFIEEINQGMGSFGQSYGKSGLEKSGVAIRELAQQSDDNTFHFVSSLLRGVSLTGTVLIEFLRETLTAGQAVRILGTDKQPRMEQIRDINVGRYDVFAVPGGSFATQRLETQEMLTRMIERAPDLLPIFGGMLFDSMDYPRAREIAQTFKRHVFQTNPGILSAEDRKQIAQELKQEQGAEQPDPRQQVMEEQARQLQQQAVQMELQGKELDLAKKESEVMAKQLDVEKKALEVKEKEIDLMQKKMGGVQFRADGGPVQAGRPYVVGERGAELFVPTEDGAVVPDFGDRMQGGKKGLGYFGQLPMRDGSGQVATEITADADVDGKKIYFPLLVPTLDEEEIDHLLSGKQATPKIFNKAIDHALTRMKKGLSPYAD